MLVAWNPLPLDWISTKVVDLFSSHSHDIHIASHHGHTAVILKHNHEDANVRTEKSKEEASTESYGSLVHGDHVIQLATEKNNLILPDFRAPAFAKSFTTLSLSSPFLPLSAIIDWSLSNHSPPCHIDANLVSLRCTVLVI
jgi:hypothetical protein